MPRPAGFATRAPQSAAVRAYWFGEGPGKGRAVNGRLRPILEGGCRRRGRFAQFWPDHGAQRPEHRDPSVLLMALRDEKTGRPARCWRTRPARLRPVRVSSSRIGALSQGRENEERGSIGVCRRETGMCALSSFGIRLTSEDYRKFSAFFALSRRGLSVPPSPRIVHLGMTSTC